MKNLSIRIKVIVPIVVLALVVLLSSISGMFNSKRLLKAGYDISDNCAKSIEYLMGMSANLNSIENDINNHCGADNTITKNEYKGVIDEELAKMEQNFEKFEALLLTDKEDEYYGAMKAKFEKYKESMNNVLGFSSAGDDESAKKEMDVSQRPLENYLAYKIDSLIEMILYHNC